jgi:hypothetical protein
VYCINIHSHSSYKYIRLLREYVSLFIRNTMGMKSNVLDVTLVQTDMGSWGCFFPIWETFHHKTAEIRRHVNRDTLYERRTASSLERCWLNAETHAGKDKKNGRARTSATAKWIIIARNWFQTRLQTCRIFVFTRILFWYIFIFIFLLTTKFTRE